MGRQAMNTRPNVHPTVKPAIKHLLSSNEAPSEAEISFLHGVEAFCSTRLACLEGEIATLLSSLRDSETSRALKRLKDDRAVWQDRSRQVLSALSTIRRLPQEILQEIFLHLISDAGVMVLDPTEGAWAASRVCRSWRSASRHPLLWTNFRIMSSRCGCIWREGVSHRCPAFIRYKDPVAILQTALRYSGSCKLDFHVEIRLYDCVGNRSRIDSLLDALMVHSKRWACVSLTVPCELGMYLGGVEGKVPELKRLTFVGCDSDSLWEAWQEDSAPLITAFAVTPKLREVSVKNAVLRLDYVGLTSFTSNYSVYFPGGIPLLVVIGCGVDLVYVEANLNKPEEGDDFEVETVEPVISNTSITHLTFNSPTPLAYLSLPALSSLDIGDISPLSCLPFIPAFLDRSQCSLTRLYFRDSALSGEPKLADILEFVPCLTDLGVGFYTYRDVFACRSIDLVLVELMQSLSEVDGEQHRLVPKLESIDFNSRTPSEDSQFIGPDLVEMLRSRKRTLRRASFQWEVAFFPNLSEACIGALHEMQRDGLDITLRASEYAACGGAVL